MVFLSTIEEIKEDALVLMRKGDKNWVAGATVYAALAQAEALDKIASALRIIEVQGAEIREGLNSVADALSGISSSIDNMPGGITDKAVEEYMEREKKSLT